MDPVPVTVFARLIGLGTGAEGSGFSESVVPRFPAITRYIEDCFFKRNTKRRLLKLRKQIKGDSDLRQGLSENSLVPRLNQNSEDDRSPRVASRRTPEESGSDNHDLEYLESAESGITVGTLALTVSWVDNLRRGKCLVVGENVRMLSPIKTNPPVRYGKPRPTSNQCT